MEGMWEALSEDEKEDIGYVLGNKAFEDGYWKGVFHKLGKDKEYDAFYKAYNEINNVIPSDYLGVKGENKMKVGDRVICKDGCREYVGWIASIKDGNPYPYSIVKNRKDIGKSFGELDNLYRDGSAFDVFKLEHLTLLEYDPCQYCNLTERELKMVQSELNDAYAMLQNRDNKIKELESEIKHYEL